MVIDNDDDSNGDDNNGGHLYLTFPFLKTIMLKDLSNQMLSPSPCNAYFARSLYCVGSF
jgi:hypothetical protein